MHSASDLSDSAWETRRRLREAARSAFGACTLPTDSAKLRKPPAHHRSAQSRRMTLPASESKRRLLPVRRARDCRRAKKRPGPSPTQERLGETRLAFVVPTEKTQTKASGGLRRAAPASTGDDKMKTAPHRRPGGGEPSYAMPMSLFAMLVPTRVIEESAAIDAVVFDRRSYLKESSFARFQN